MVCFRKRLTPEILGEINELIIQRALERKEVPANDYSDDDDSSDNDSTLIVDATYAVNDIRYQTDTSLLNEERENSEKLIDMLYIPGLEEKPRTYRRRTRKEYRQFVRIR